MSLPIHIALVPYDVDINLSEITKVAAAISKQVQRDFMAIWNVNATVDAFASLEDVPIDYWNVIIMKDVQGAAGYHQDEHGQPYAVVEFGSNWSITASHEILEMLADPFGKRLRAGNVLAQAVQLGFPSTRVRYLVEICDPSEARQFSYQVNGIQVSDFYTPNFFDPVKAQGVRYSFTGAIDAPRKVLDGGYISWLDTNSGHWFQVRMFRDDISNDVPHIVNLSTQTAFEEFKAEHGVRGAIDRVTKTPFRKNAENSLDDYVKPQKSKAKDIRNQIDQLRKQ